MSNFTLKIKIKKDNDSKSSIDVSLNKQSLNVQSIKLPKHIAKVTKVVDSEDPKPIKVLKRIIVHNEKVKGGTYGRRQWVNLEEQYMTEHYSKIGNLTQLDPSYHGSGAKGAESKRKRTYPEIYIDRIYHYMKGTDPETIFEKKSKYFGRFSANDIYDFNKDPLNIKKYQLKTVGNSPEALTRTEREVFERGFKGMMCNIASEHPILISFTQHDVKRARKFIVNLSSAKTESSKNRMRELVESTNKAMSDGKQRKIHEITKKAIDIAFDSPFISIDKATPTMGLYDGGEEASYELHLSGDPKVILGRTALFLKTFDQDSGIIREITNEPVESAIGKEVAKTLDVKLDEDDWKKAFNVVKECGFGGATFDPDQNRLYVCHIPECEYEYKNGESIPTIRHSVDGFNAEADKLKAQLLKDGFRTVDFRTNMGQIFLHKDKESKNVDSNTYYDYFIREGIERERELLGETIGKNDKINRNSYEI